MRLYGVAALVVASCAVSATADSTSFSFELGLIVGSAEVCGYSLNEDAVSAYVAQNVPGSDLRFASTFQMHVGFHESEAKKLTGVALRIHCESARRSAEHLGLVAAP